MLETREKKGIQRVNFFDLRTFFYQFYHFIESKIIEFYRQEMLFRNCEDFTILYMRKNTTIVELMLI